MTIADLAERLWVPRWEAEANGFPGIDRLYGRSLTDDRIVEAERVLGVHLPISLLEFLRAQNGGYLRTRETELSGLYVDFRDLPGLGTPSGIDGETGARYMADEWGYPADTLYLGGDGHNGILLDYRSQHLGEPPVVWIDVEEDPPVIKPLASDFAEFLRLLVEHALKD